MRVFFRALTKARSFFCVHGSGERGIGAAPRPPSPTPQKQNHLANRIALIRTVDSKFVILRTKPSSNSLAYSADPTDQYALTKL